MDNMTINEESAKTPPPPPAKSRAMRLTKLASTHVLVFVVALSLFAAADSWSTSKARTLRHTTRS